LAGSESPLPLESFMAIRRESFFSISNSLR
jgi:hypothetical protein